MQHQTGKIIYSSKDPPPEEDVGTRLWRAFMTLSIISPEQMPDQETDSATLTLSGYRYWKTIETIRTIGVDQAAFFALIGVAFAGKLPDKTLAETIKEGFNMLVQRYERESWKNPTDYLVSFTYHQQRTHMMTRHEAAEFASKMLGKPISMHAWRMRVDRWARDHGLPPVEHRKRGAPTPRL